MSFLNAAPPLDVSPKDPNTVDTADAYTSTKSALGAWLAAERAKSVAMGLADPDTGLPTRAGFINAMRTVAMSVALGRGAPAGGIRASLAKEGAGSAEVAADTANSLASRTNTLHNVPDKLPRPFEADYPAGAPADGSGRLAADIDGRPLGARFIAGRRALGGADEAVTPAEFNALSEAAIGTRPEAVAAGQISGDAGRFVKTADPATGDALYNVYVNRNLSPAGQDIAIGHELGHMVDELAGQLSSRGVSRELAQVYNTMSTGQERTRHLTAPGNLGYSADDAPRELWASAIHAYLTNPNYLKTVAPKAAAAIRAAVNGNSRLRDTIQFNGLAGMAAGAAADSGEDQR